MFQAQGVQSLVERIRRRVLILIMHHEDTLFEVGR